MKKLTLPALLPLMFTAALTTWAADVWVKPYTDWNEKDIQKIMTDSPWTKRVSIIFENGGGGGGAAGGGKGGRTSGPQGSVGLDPGIDGNGGGAGGGGGRGGRGGGGGGGDVGGGGGGGVPETELIIRWQSAPTIVEALVKHKYGSEAATNPDAQKQLKADDMYYVISVSGLPGGMRPRDEDSKKALLQVTTLSAKDKDSIAAADVLFPAPAEGRSSRTTDAYFLFPRKITFTADDKEVEFSTKFGKNAVKTKFALKPMVVNGKLGL